MRRAGRARDRRGHALSRDQPSKRDIGRLRSMTCRHLIECLQDRLASRIQILPDRFSAPRFREVVLRAVLAGEEAGRETVVGHDTESLFDTQISQWPVKGSAIVK